MIFLVKSPAAQVAGVLRRPGPGQQRVGRRRSVGTALGDGGSAGLVDQWKPWENHGKTIGKPWENHGKTIGKP